MHSNVEFYSRMSVSIFQMKLLISKIYENGKEKKKDFVPHKKFLKTVSRGFTAHQYIPILFLWPMQEPFTSPPHPLTPLLPPPPPTYLMHSFRKKGPQSFQIANVGSNIS